MHLQELGEHKWEMNLEGARIRRTEYNSEWGEFIDTGELFYNSGFNILAWIPGTGSNYFLGWFLEA